MSKKKIAGEYFERNLEDCCELVRSVKLSDFLPNSKSVLNVFQNYRHAYGLNDVAFFLTSLTGMGHFGNSSSTYCGTTNSFTKSSLFLVLVGASGMFMKNQMFYFVINCLRKRSLKEIAHIIFERELRYPDLLKYCSNTIS
jgi:hypothetical protein